MTERRTIGDLRLVSDGWLREHSEVSSREMIDPDLPSERRAFAASAFFTITAEMIRRCIPRTSATVIPFPKRKPKPDVRTRVEAQGAILGPPRPVTWPGPEREDER
jgi:hypothetical protein